MVPANFNKCGFLLVERDLAIPDTLPALDQITNVNLQPFINQIHMTNDAQIVEGSLNLKIFYAPVEGSETVILDLPADPNGEDQPVSYLKGMSKDFFDDGFSDHDELEDETISVRNNFHFINLESRDWHTIASLEDEGGFSQSLELGSLRMPRGGQIWPRVKFLEYRINDPRNLHLTFLISLEAVDTEPIRMEASGTEEHQITFPLPDDKSSLEDVVDYTCFLVTGMGESKSTWELEIAFLGRDKEYKPLLGITRLSEDFKGQLPEELANLGTWPVYNAVLTPVDQGIKLIAQIPAASASTHIEREEPEEVIPALDEDDNDRDDYVIPFSAEEEKAVGLAEFSWLQKWINADGISGKEVDIEMGRKVTFPFEEPAKVSALENNTEATEEEIQDESSEGLDDGPEGLEEQEERKVYQKAEEIEEAEEAEEVEELEEIEETEETECQDEYDEECREDNQDQYQEDNQEDYSEEQVGDHRDENYLSDIQEDDQRDDQDEDQNEDQNEGIEHDDEEDRQGYQDDGEQQNGPDGDDGSATIEEDIEEAEIPNEPKINFHGITAEEFILNRPMEELDFPEYLEESGEILSLSTRRRRLQAALRRGTEVKGSRGMAMISIDPRKS